MRRSICQTQRTTAVLNAASSLDPSKPAPDLKEGFNTGYIRPGPVPEATQPLPSLLAAHAAELADFQHRCFEFCQRLLVAFAVALEVRYGLVWQRLPLQRHLD